MQTYKFTDETISHIAKLLQIALLTGTDIIDNLRSVTVTSNKDGELALAPDYSENFDKNIETMLKDAESLEDKSDDEVIKIDLSNVTPLNFGSDS